MDNVRALPDTDKETQPAHSWNPDDQSQNIRNITADYIVIKPDTDETHINFENRWNFNWCEQRPVDNALQWEVSDQKDVQFIYRNSIINASVLVWAVFRHEKVLFFKNEILPTPVQLRLLSVKG